MNATVTPAPVGFAPSLDSLWETFRVTRAVYYSSPKVLDLPIDQSASSTVAPALTPLATTIRDSYLAAQRDLRAFFAVLGAPVAAAFDEYKLALGASTTNADTARATRAAAEVKLRTLVGDHPDLRSAVAHAALDFTAATDDYWEVNEAFQAGDAGAASASEVGQMAQLAARAATLYEQALLVLADALGDIGETSGLRSMARVFARHARNYAATASRYGR